MCVPWREGRLSVRPGITGLWQVCRHDRSIGDFHQWIYYDLLYVGTCRSLVDLKIVLATIATIGGKSSVPLDWILSRSKYHDRRRSRRGPDADARQPSCAEPEPRVRFIARVRSIAIRSLSRMYRPEERLFVFRLRRDGETIVSEGLSRRYTAITLIGLAKEEPHTVAAVLGAHDLQTVYGRLLQDITETTQPRRRRPDPLGGLRHRSPGSGAAVERLRALHPETVAHPTVELAWVVSALTLDPGAADDLREAAVRRLLASFNRHIERLPSCDRGGTARTRSLPTSLASPTSSIPPRRCPSTPSSRARPRPGTPPAACADYMCRMQGRDGQWWWHYDYRTGNVSSATPYTPFTRTPWRPMALFAASGGRGPVLRRGRSSRPSSGWRAAPSSKAGTLLDDRADLIWRKVARREPNKLSRYAQALVSRVHRNLRVPGLDAAVSPRGPWTTKTAPTIWVGSSTPFPRPAPPGGDRESSREGRPSALRRARFGSSSACPRSRDHGGGARSGGGGDRAARATPDRRRERGEDREHAAGPVLREDVLVFRRDLRRRHGGGLG